MARSDDALGRTSTPVRAVEGLLAYAQTQRRWGRPARGALSSAGQAVSLSRDLAAHSPAHTLLLVRALRTTARLHLERGQPAEALPLAEEAVALARRLGGDPLVISLEALARIYDSLQRYGEATSAIAEAGKHNLPE